MLKNFLIFPYPAMASANLNPLINPHAKFLTSKSKMVTCASVLRTRTSPVCARDAPRPPTPLYKRGGSVLSYPHSQTACWFPCSHPEKKHGLRISLLVIFLAKVSHFSSSPSQSKDAESLHHSGHRHRLGLRRSGYSLP